MTAVIGGRQPHVVLLQVPWFDPEHPAGGAEVVAAQVATRLAHHVEVSVLHGWPTSHAVPEREQDSWGPSLAAVSAFPIDDHLRHAGVIRPRLTPGARATLNHADLLVTVERVLDLDIDVPRLACLGGSGYPHAPQVLRSGLWDRLVVPSDSVLRELDPTPSEADRIHVIPNGIDTSRFRPRAKPDGRWDGRRLIRLLVPSRPGWEKGYGRALGLARALQERGHDVELTCLRHRGFLDTDEFHDRFAVEAARLRLRVLPWQEHHEMPALYHEADLTLCLSEIPEGFGLAAAESVASGTPVLATRSGFLGRMLPAGHGLHLVEHSAPSSALADAALEALVAGRSRCLARGRPHIAQHYGLDRMQRAYADLVDALLARRNHSPAGARAVRLDAPSNARQSPPSSHRIGSWDA